MRYDIAVIGNDEAAFEMLELAACTNKRAIAVLPETRHSDWLMTQALRRLTASLLVDRTENRRRMFRNAASPRLLRSLLSAAVFEEISEQTRLLKAAGIDVVTGQTHFTDADSLTIDTAGGSATRRIRADHIVIGTGVLRTAVHQRLTDVAFQSPDKLLRGRTLPNEIHVIGGGDFGTGLATLLSIFGVRTGLVTREDGSAVLSELAAAAGVITGHRPGDVGLPDFAVPFPNSERGIVDCRRSVGFTNHLNLAAVGVEADENGQLWCAGNFETWCSGIFGIGGVVGFSPATSLEAASQAERVMNRIIHKTTPKTSRPNARFAESA